MVATLRKLDVEPCHSTGERRLGVWEAVVFGASHAESALADSSLVVCCSNVTHLIAFGDRDVSGCGSSARESA